MKSTDTSCLPWLPSLTGFRGIHRLHDGRIITGLT